MDGTAWRASQEQLLQYAHGGLVEYFGGRSASSATCQVSFPLNEEVCDPKTFFFKKKFSALLEQVQSWRRNPEKVFLVYGRGPAFYTSYEAEYEWQNYLYSTYLLGAGPNTEFKYATTFQFPQVLANGGRADGLHLYDNQLIDLGAPLSREHLQSGMYWRKFENALVIVVPHDSATSANPSLLSSLFPAGYKTVIPASLAQGRALIVTNQTRYDDMGRIMNFRLAEVKATFIEPPMRRDSAGSLIVKETNPASMNDILLNLVKYRTHGSILTLRLKNNYVANPSTQLEGAKLTAVAEVNDDAGKVRFVAFELYKSASLPRGYPSSVTKGRPLFRVPETTVTKDQALYIREPNQFKVNNSVEDIYFDPKKSLNAYPGLKFKRWEFIRFHGDYYLYEIRILGSQEASGALGLGG